MEELFRKLEINDNEREVYLAVLRAGKIAATQVSRETSINRTTVYSIAKKLESMGIIAIDVGQKISYLVAIPPDQLVNIFEKKKGSLPRRNTPPSGLPRNSQASRARSTILYRGLNSSRRMISKNTFM